MLYICGYGGGSNSGNLIEYIFDLNGLIDVDSHGVRLQCGEFQSEHKLSCPRRNKEIINSSTSHIKHQLFNSTQAHSNHDVNC